LTNSQDIFYPKGKLFFTRIYKSWRSFLVTLPRQEPGASLGYKFLGPPGCHSISRRESGVLCGWI